MLSILFKDGSEVNWHVGNKLHVPFEEVCNVVDVQADGHELVHILENFENIPTRRFKRVVRWFGDDAKFIVANL